VIQLRKEGAAVKGNFRCIFLVLLVAILLTGCSVTTVEQMYQLPKRSEDYNDLQSAIDKAMTGLEYCAPLTGENQQTVQMADLDGDGQDEYLLFAKGTQEKPLRILVFQEVEETFVNICNVECSGSAFDQIEYVNMDGRDGVEIVVGRQLSDQVIRSASVYSLAEGELHPLTSVNYTKFLTVDLNNDSYSELFLLRPGQTDTDYGVAELYSMESGTMVRYNEVNMSQPADKLKRLIVGRLVGGKAAVYVASAVGDTALITDVYTIVDGKLTNVTLSNESGTSIQTMRNFYVYADDIDNDGIVELPSLITMKPKANAVGADAHQLIRWYSMTPTGEEVDKMFTYHNFVGGWYMQIDSELASRLVVVQQGYQTEFYIWNNRFTSTSKLMTISALTGQNREEQGLSQGRFVLQKTESVVYSAQLEEAAVEFGLDRESAVYSFRMIQQDWKTGET
jgi:hypothetical protein